MRPVFRTAGRAAVAVAALALAAAACGNPFASADARIRLRNASEFVLTDITFRPGEPRLEFPRLEPGQVTPYRTVENAYSYGYLDVHVAGERKVLQPVDYVGESHIGPGRYTYVITVDPVSRNPHMTLVED